MEKAHAELQKFGGGGLRSCSQDEDCDDEDNERASAESAVEVEFSEEFPGFRGAESFSEVGRFNGLV